MTPGENKKKLKESLLSGGIEVCVHEQPIDITGEMKISLNYVLFDETYD